MQSNRSPNLHTIQAESTYQVFDWLWSSGQLTEADIARLPAMEIDVVINLAMPTSSNALPREAEYVTREGISYIHIPVEWEQPEYAQLLQFLGVIKALAGQRIWVHCAKNMRVSVFIYLYRRLCLNHSEEEARYPMREVWVPNATWQTFIEQAINKYQNSLTHNG